mgnify:CR=1 FL=1
MYPGSFVSSIINPGVSMNLPSIMKKNQMIAGCLTLLAVFILRPAVAQEKKESDSKSTVKLKVITEKNGETNVFDTTLISEENIITQEEVEALMRDLQDKMGEFSDQMREYQFLFDPGSPDTLLSDSVRKEIKRALRMLPGKGCEGLRFPRGRAYQFDFPCMPDCPGPPEMAQRFRWGGRMPGRVIQRMMQREETLSDLIGEIPLDQVKQYSIKERKGGKRIIIDVDDAPVVVQRDRIIYREGVPMKVRDRYMKRQPKEVKVIIKAESGEEENAPKTPEPPQKAGENQKKI